MSYLPVMMDFNNKQVVVVGGGKVAERRVQTLLPTMASIIVVSPEVTSELAHLHEQNKIVWQAKAFSASDVQKAALVITATNNPKINDLVRRSCPAHVLVNATDDADKGDIHFPAHVQRGKLSIAVSTNGASPMLTKKIKTQLEEMFDEEYEQYVDFLYEVRLLLKSSLIPVEKRKAILQSFVERPPLSADEQEYQIQAIKQRVKEK
ncbi:NAD(P)-binding protein [Radiobacillus kanasensis]|uniref:NAD(P)-binding protein n=1 Tax=Radiobacillus kanasensis TaxID=2844358 RepID=UPI001E46E16F|nr:NAD(P)-binding protein [Radiobacillus kanasensis]UFU00677.1 NAD(P)-binding protein [Radiobacillus kanasensis]